VRSSVIDHVARSAAGVQVLASRDLKERFGAPPLTEGHVADAHAQRVGLRGVSLQRSELAIGAAPVTDTRMRRCRRALKEGRRRASRSRSRRSRCPSAGGSFVSVACSNLP